MGYVPPATLVLPHQKGVVEADPRFKAGAAGSRRRSPKKSERLSLRETSTLLFLAVHLTSPSRTLVRVRVRARVRVRVRGLGLGLG